MALSLTANRNNRTAILMAAIALGMVGLSFASVPLYRIFCQVTGYGGTTQVAANSYDVPILNREMTVGFIANTSPALPWKFEPVQRQVRIKVGQEALIYYKVTNLGNEELVGTATFNVTPDKAGLYFNKIECFCFIEQRLAPGETIELPVTFFIDPAVADDANLDEVEEITLSYTFFKAKQQ